MCLTLDFHCGNYPRLRELVHRMDPRVGQALERKLAGLTIREQQQVANIATQEEYQKLDRLCRLMIAKYNRQFAQVNDEYHQIWTAMMWFREALVWLLDQPDPGRQHGSHRSHLGTESTE